MRIQYEFDLKKVVRIVPSNGMPAIIIGEVEEYFENGSVVKTIIKLDPKLRKELVDRILENPGMLSITGKADNARNAILLPEITD